MPNTYDKYYQTQDLFGAAYPELISFFSKLKTKGKLLDLGCGQGRDAIALARLGFEVTGIDNSQVGIEQMNAIAKTEKLALAGVVTDIFAFDGYEAYDFVLLDSMFHFQKKEQKKETDFVKRIVSRLRKDALLVVCIQDSGKKVQILNEAIDAEERLERVADVKFDYTFTDEETGHTSKTAYRMVVAKK